jgi:carboxymethylenebutenolidase
MGRMLQLKAKDGFTLGAYRADPSGKPKAGLVVLQEIFGVNHHMRAVCDRFAAEGYAALAPALFDRAEAAVELDYDDTSADRGIALRAAIKLDDSLQDVQAAIDAVADAGKVGVVGYCWGGSLAFLAAARLSGVSGAVGYYGGMIARHAQEKPTVPTILHFGERDDGIPMTAVETVRAARPEVKIYTYPAGHGFSCDERASYDAESSRKALAVTLAFFRETLEN